MRKILKKIGVKEFEKMLGGKVSSLVAKKLKSAKLAYSPLSNTERDGVILKILGILLDDSIPFSGAHRKKQWEKGWGENFAEYEKKPDSTLLAPKYFYKYKIGRIYGEFVKHISPKFELQLSNIIAYWVIETYFKKIPNIFEFGCGTGYNLLKIREINQTANITGLDWVTSSQKTIKLLAKNMNDKKMFTKQFDYFHPNHFFKLPLNSGVFTMASLEQTGQNYKKFVEYLLKNKPEIVVHLEPITELLSENKLVDQLAIQYAKKRKYLNGYLNYLKELEKKGKIKIHTAKRTNVGSYFNESNSLIVWSPI